MTGQGARYWISGEFGARAASNSTSVCLDCGAVVWNEREHDAWHEALGALLAAVEKGSSDA